MTYIVRAQGYGGGGASVPPYKSDDRIQIKMEIESLLETDHAVQLYKILPNGEEKEIEFQSYMTYHVNFEG